MAHVVKSPARWRDASITSTAASWSSSKKVEKAIKSLWVRAIRPCIACSAQGIPGEGRSRTPWPRRALVESNARLTVTDRDRLLGFLEGTGISILPEPGSAAHHRDAQSAGPRWAQNVEVLRQYDRSSRRPGLGRQEAQVDADRSGLRAAHRSGRSRQMPGVGSAQEYIRTPKLKPGCSRAAAPPASAAWNARSR